MNTWISAPVSYRVILAEQIQISPKVIHVMVKWEMDYLIFTKQPLTPANCIQLISAGFSSHVRWLHVSILLWLSAPQHLGLRFFSDLIHSLCFELRCPAGIVNQLPTQAFNLLSHSWLCPGALFATMTSLSAHFWLRVWSFVSVKQPLNTISLSNVLTLKL